MNIVLEDKDVKIITETTKYILGHLWESAFLVDKINNMVIELTDFYGDPQCGVINDDFDWCVVGGDFLVVWKNKSVNFIEKDVLKYVYDIRIKNSNTVELLIDPWADNSAVWELNINTLNCIKLFDFYEYKDKPYCKNVVW